MRPPLRTGDPLEEDRVAEVGPLLLDETQPILPPTGVHQGKLPAFRVESFGGTVLDIDLFGAQAALFVQGPLPGPDGDDSGPVPLVAQAGAKYDAGAHLTGVRLSTRGVYRVIVADSAALDAGDPLGHPFTMASRCTSGLLCERPFVSSPPASLVDQESVELLVSGAHLAGNPVAVSKLLRTPRGQVTYAGVLMAVAAQPKHHALPAFDLHNDFLSALVNGSDLDDDGPLPEPMTGELTALLGGCDVARAHPVPVKGPFAGGSFPDLSLPRCQVAASVRLATVLNSLVIHTFRRALSSRSRVSYRGRTYTRAEELASALLDAGHRIELIEERSLVRTSTVSIDGKDILWPVWMNTGFVMDGGETLRMPAGRSRIVWRISGPDVNARIALGSKRGTAWFVPQLERPPGWVGRRIAEVSTDPVRVVDSFRAAAYYIRRDDYHEQEQPLSSLGTSSDAAAALQRLVWDGSDERLPFPLLRTRRVDTYLPPSTGPNQERLGDMPYDYDDWLKAGWSTDPKANRDGPVRLYNMTPFATDSPMLDLFPPSVRFGLCQLEQNARQPLSPACRSILYAGALR
jgi:hypothetical protein